MIRFRLAAAMLIIAGTALCGAAQAPNGAGDWRRTARDPSPAPPLDGAPQPPFAGLSPPRPRNRNPRHADPPHNGGPSGVTGHAQ